MSPKTNRIDITDLVTVDISNYKGSTWIHVRRKSKSVSIPFKDFKKLLSKQSEVKKLAQKYEQRNKSSKSKPEIIVDSDWSSNDSDSN